jgi:hypothetical protein
MPHVSKTILPKPRAATLLRYWTKKCAAAGERESVDVAVGAAGL